MKSLRLLLIPLSFLYWIVTVTRNWFFEIGLLKTTRLHVPVISVGNISTGGTGKTPFVEVVVQKLSAKGHRPAIVSRGYGRRSRGYVLVSDGKGTVKNAIEAGDEPVLLAGKLKTTPIAVDESRVEGAKRVLAETTADCIVLDDGFQHRYLHRDLDIVLVTAREILSGPWLLPAGNRRESVASIRRADAVVISKCAVESDYNKAAAILRNAGSDRIAGFRYESGSLRKVSTGAAIERSSLSRLSVAVAAGLGDFDSFKNSVEQLGCSVNVTMEYSDHHWYTEEDMKEMEKEVRARKVDLLITTEKDLVRIRALKKCGEEFLNTMPVCILEVKTKFLAGEEMIDSLLEGVFA